MKNLRARKVYWRAWSYGWGLLTFLHLESTSIGKRYENRWRTVSIEEAKRWADTHPNPLPPRDEVDPKYITYLEQLGTPEEELEPLRARVREQDAKAQVLRRLDEWDQVKYSGCICGGPSPCHGIRDGQECYTHEANRKKAENGSNEKEQ